MKPHVSVTILFAGLLLVAVCLFIANRVRSNRSKKEAIIESAKASFLEHNKNASIDSTHIHNDTLLFYSHGIYVGKTVIVTE